MSDNKHVQNDALWNKISPATNAAGVTARLQYNATMGGSMPTAAAAGSLLFGGPATVTTTNHGEINFAAARFQAPSIHQQHVSNPTIAATLAQSMATAPAAAANFAHHHHTSTPSIAPSNVPVYPPTAAATSVLTPNPFAAVAGGATTATTPAALQQLFHAMNSAAVASLANSTAMGSPLSLNTQTSPQIAAVSSPSVHGSSLSSRAAVTAPDLPSPSSNSSAGVGIMPSTSGFSGAITSTIAENVLSAIGGLAQHATPARNMGFGVKSTPDEEKLRRIHQMVEASVSDHAKQQIAQILDCISTLKPVEKLLLYLRLPGAAPETDPLRQPQNPLGTRSEINHTINWVRSHLEQDPNVSIPKQDVYNDYIAYCERLDIKPLSTADFGKVMKQVFPGIRPRRLGTRGNSRYCYAAMRKTTKLASPQLPPLGAGTSSDAANSAADQLSSSATDLSDHNLETWTIIKSWAENMLQVKIENVNDLATIIKGSGSTGSAGVSTVAGRTSITHKKFGNRETKEKRLLTDMGPLKKRRKKKRKGSSSSESSYNSQPPIKQSSNEKEPVQSTTATETKTATMQNAPIAVTTSEQLQQHKSNLKIEDETMKLVAVKEEFIELPNNQRLQHLSPPSRHVAALGDNYLQQQQQQPQMLPINLAPEQRTVLTRAPAAVSAFNSALPPHRLHSAYGAAAKNLVPKIMELAAANTINEAANTSQASFSPVNQPNAIVPLIKEEEADEYNTANILCKKVRKAQQTKGVWQQPVGGGTNVAGNNATNVTHIVPVITTSAATPTPQQDTPAAAAGTANTPSPNYLMGPPAAATSTSPFDTSGGSIGTHLTPHTPKVASRNMAQLRAKRLQLAAAAAAAQAAADANAGDDLPESLGLPRERVISICNMDKHELDDYFINGEEEEENSNEPDTELLQYFQTGDAEEKLNSSDAGKQRNPTTAAAAAAVATAQQQISGVHNAAVTQPRAAQAAVHTVVSNVLSALTGALPITTKAAAITTTTTTTQAALLANTTVVNAAATTTATLAKATTKTTTITAPVGSASASLAFMSQKHQQQQLLQQQQLQQQQQQQKQHFQHNNSNIATTAANKRKIPPSVATVKHCTFAPISPNINHAGNNLSNTTSNGAGSAPLASVSNDNALNAGLFASPGLTPPTRLRPKPAFGKQQSLDIDLASSISFPANSALSSMHDPMIGATRRRRNYTNVTSASAPPSPSILHQQQQQQLFSAQHFQNAAVNQWQTLLSTTSSAVTASGGMHATAATSFLNDQNSLDLDLFGAANATTHANNNNAGHYGAGIDVAGAFSFDEYVTETQRSQSVPLSQLQRIHSPPAHRNGNANTANRAIVDFNIVENSLMCSENSSSQHSSSTIAANNAANIIKLEDATTAAAVDIAASDSAALLDGVDVSEILSSPDFVQNFTSIAQQQGNVALATTTCSSAGSSSGYSSGACTTFTGSGNIISRSVPSTPLPHHHQNLFGQSSINFYNQRRRSGFINDELQLSPGGNGYVSANIGANKFSHNNNNVNSNSSSNNNNNNNSGPNNNNSSSLSFGNNFGSRSIYDISKSMPTTPITTPCFRYSPEFNRDFLINGNTIDDSIGFGTVGGSDSLLGGGAGSNAANSNVIVSSVSAHDDESVNLASNLNAEALLSTDDVSVPGADDVLLGNL